jgi:hypothetical protein
MEVYGTDQILALATFVNQGADMYYWDDFLGDNDVGFFGQKLVRGEDRIFSTSVAINALIDTWSTYSPNCTIFNISSLSSLIRLAAHHLC